MHSCSLKCQSDQQRLEDPAFLSLTCRLFLYIFIYLNVHMFFVQTIAALFSLSFKLHYLPLFLKVAFFNNDV